MNGETWATEPNLLPFVLAEVTRTALTTESTWGLTKAVFTAGFTLDHVLLPENHERRSLSCDEGRLATIKVRPRPSAQPKDVTKYLALLLPRNSSRVRQLNPKQWVTFDNLLEVAGFLALMLTKGETHARFLGHLRGESPGSGLPETCTGMLGDEKYEGSFWNPAERLAFDHSRYNSQSWATTYDFWLGRSVAALQRRGCIYAPSVEAVKAAYARQVALPGEAPTLEVVTDAGEVQEGVCERLVNDTKQRMDKFAAMCGRSGVTGDGNLLSGEEASGEAWEPW